MENNNSQAYTKLLYNVNWGTSNYQYETRDFATYKPNHITKDTGIIIDNGSYKCRAGWSTCENPNITFRSVVGKVKQNLKNTTFLVGNDLMAVEQGKLQKKSPFEKNLVSHFGTQENILDYVFSNLKINDSEVSYPVVFTEPLCNLNHSRKNITEMLFELYGIPSLCYGVDMLYSLFYNKKSMNVDSLLISSSYQTTSVVPIIEGNILLDKCRRISIGGYQHLELLTKSIHLRFPDFKAKFTNEMLQEIQENYTMTSINYKSQLKLLEEIFLRELQKQKEAEIKRIYGTLEMYQKANVQTKIEKHKNLRPYVNSVVYNNQFFSEKQDVINKLVSLEWPKVNEVVLSEEEIKRKQEIRHEQGKRLREMMQKKREEKIKGMEKEYEELEKLLYLKETDKYQFEETLLSKGFSNQEDLQKRINKISTKINNNRDAKDEEAVEEEKKWPLLNIPDEDLNEDQLRSKRIQKMQRSAYVTRLEKREAMKLEKQRIEELKSNEPERYLVDLYRKKKELLIKIEGYKQLRKDYQNRHSKINQKRMMVLAELGKENERPTRKNDKVDEFGKNDEDWEIYRGLSKNNISEDEEEDVQQLNDVEAQIIEMDPNYRNNEYEFNNEETHSLLGIDQFRGGELIFQPNIIGVDQAGLTETINSVLKLLTPDEQRRVVGNVFLTGGNFSSPYCEDRIEYDLRSSVNCDYNINVVKASNPALDAWKGARQSYLEDRARSNFITRQEYMEYGPEYFKAHPMSNIPIKSLQNETPNKKNKGHHHK